MGLDNGIILKVKNKVILPKNFHFCWSNNDWEESKYKYNENDNIDAKYQIDICYFRKYWNLRSMIIDKFNNQDYTCFTLEDIQDLRDALFNLTNEKIWNENPHPLWSYQEALPHMNEMLDNLDWLIGYMKITDPINYKVFWYDSY